MNLFLLAVTAAVIGATLAAFELKTCDPYRRCAEGEGDCDGNDDCNQGLECGMNNCEGGVHDCCEYVTPDPRLYQPNALRNMYGIYPSPQSPPSVYKPPTSKDCRPESNDKNCCSSSYPCSVGQGDCDKDRHCQGGLECGNNNCRKYSRYASKSLDCCEAPSYGPVDGGWGKWGSWSFCEQSCGTGVKSRKRSCNKPRRKNGGARCPGDRYDTKPCYGLPRCENQECATLYTDDDFAGSQLIMYDKDATTLPSRFRNRVSSCGVTSGCTLTMYDGSAFSQRKPKEDVTEDIRDLGDLRVSESSRRKTWDNRMSSCKCNCEGSGGCPCPKIYKPVCGYDRKTYANDCIRKCENAIKECDGECPCQKCERICPAIYQPVCGVDGITYDNECKCNCKTTKKCEGTCPCQDCPCPEIYKPVCGLDGNTYGNECKCNCKTTKKCDGECPCREPKGDCPKIQPKINSDCSAYKDGLKCNYGEECCCGRCSDSLKLTCNGQLWFGFNTDVCAFVTPPCPECRIENDIDYYGHDIQSNLPANNDQDCANLCLKNRECFFWSYRTRSKKCFLKTSERGRKKERGVVSGQKACGVPEECKWSQWSRCDKDCGYGKQTRHTIPKYQHSHCERTEEERQCEGRGGRCEGQWSEWSCQLCTPSCGRLRTRDCSRTCNRGPGGRGCIGEAEKIRRCQPHVCPEECNWSQWSQCDKDCGYGKQTRHTIPKNYNSNCERKEENRQCEGKNCPGTWSEWSCKECTPVCGPHRTRDCTRNCNRRPGGRDCIWGEAEKIRRCSAKDCPEECNWSQWSQCDKDCGYGTQTRHIIPKNYHSRCDRAEQNRKCEGKNCPGTWGEWSCEECRPECGSRRYRECSRICRRGTRGRDCRGDSDKREGCSNKDCPEKCSWTQWSQCDKTCGNGRQRRHIYGCSRTDNESRHCKLRDCQADCSQYDCGQWSTWSRCVASKSKAGRKGKKKGHYSRGGNVDSVRFRWCPTIPRPCPPQNRRETRPCISPVKKQGKKKNKYKTKSGRGKKKSKGYKGWKG